MKEVVTLRPLEPNDEHFSFQVYASTRAEEMLLVAWTAQQKEEFLAMQFNAQRIHYHTYSPQAEWSVIEVDGKPAGRLIVNRAPEKAISMMDIALLPEFRGRGIGSTLIKGLMDEARAVHKKLVLHVEVFNPARRLYDRLGFQPTGSQQGVYQEMTWQEENE